MKISNEAKIGIMVSAILVILGVLTFKTGDFNFSKKGYFLKVHFHNVEGVKLNAPVMLNGFEVGTVKDIKIFENQYETMLELTVFLEETAKIREGGFAYVKNLGFMGEKYVGLTSGSPDGRYLGEGAVIVGEDPVDIDSLLLDAKAIAFNLKEISINVNERLQKNQEAIDEIFANFNVTMKNANAISTRLNTHLSLNEENIDETLSNLNSASTNLDQFTYDLKQNPWKLLYRSKEKREESIRKMQENMSQ